MCLIESLVIRSLLLVQVVKDALPSKGARITAQVSVPGRFIVLLPGASGVGVGASGSASTPAAGSGCAGFLQALDVARSRARDAEGPILVVGVEVLSKVIDLSRRETAVLFGDGAGAAILGRGATRIAEVVASVTGTDGSQASILGIHAGGTRTPFSPESAPAGRLPITMEGRKVFREAVRRMSDASAQALDKAGWSANQLALVVPHQANVRIIQAVAKALDLHSEQLFVNVEEYGNTGSASVPLALSQAYADGRLQGGDRVLLTSFGAGFHWAATALRFL